MPSNCKKRGSIEGGKRGDLTVLDVEHPNELSLAVGQNVVSSVVLAGAIVHGRPTGEGRINTDSEEPMSHTRLRQFNTRDTYPEQKLDNDLCQAVVADNIVFLRGQVGQDLETRESVGIGDPAAQAEQAMANIEKLLAEAGARLEDICKIVVYVTDIRHREPVYQVMGQWVRGVYPGLHRARRQRFRSSRSGSSRSTRRRLSRESAWRPRASSGREQLEP